MTSHELKQVLDFEAGLKPGDRVLACWTNCHRDYTEIAEVVRVNRASIRIRLVTASDGYGMGQEFPVPRYCAQRWSWNNCAMPLDGYPSTRTEAL